MEVNDPGILVFHVNENLQEIPALRVVCTAEGLAPSLYSDSSGSLDRCHNSGVESAINTIENHGLISVSILASMLSTVGRPSLTIKLTVKY